MKMSQNLRAFLISLGLVFGGMAALSYGSWPAAIIGFFMALFGVIGIVVVAMD